MIGSYVSKSSSSAVCAFKSITFTLTALRLPKTGCALAPLKKLQTEQTTEREAFMSESEGKLGGKKRWLRMFLQISPVLYGEVRYDTVLVYMPVSVWRKKENLRIKREVNWETWKKTYIQLLASFDYVPPLLTTLLNRYLLAFTAAEKQVLINFKMLSCFHLNALKLISLPKQLKKESDEGQEIAAHSSFHHS